jgi:hypothetical protein
MGKRLSDIVELAKQMISTGDEEINIEIVRKSDKSKGVIVTISLDNDGNPMVTGRYAVRNQ